MGEFEDRMRQGVRHFMSGEGHDRRSREDEGYGYERRHEHRQEYGQEPRQEAGRTKIQLCRR